MKILKITGIIFIVILSFVTIMFFLTNQSIKNSRNPTVERKISSHISQIAFSIMTIEKDTNKLPSSLSEVSDYYKPRLDTEFKYGITYKILEPNKGKFELCALYPYEDTSERNKEHEIWTIADGKLCLTVR